MTRKLVLLTLCLAAFQGHTAQVQKNSPANFENDLQNKQRLMEDITNELQKNAASAERPVSPSQIEVPQKGVEDNRTFLINNIVIDTGDESLHHLDIRPILKPYVGKKISQRDIFLLVKDANNYFAGKGFVTTAVSISPANLKQGELKLKVHWGRIQGWLINGEPVKNYQERMILRQALPGAQGSILNMHDIDQAIENINNYASSGRIEIVPAEQSGYSYLNMTTAKSTFPAFSFSIDNSGQGTSPEDGLYRYNVGYSFSNLLLGLDTLALRFNTRHLGSDGGNYNYYAGINYDIPIGYTTIGLQGSFSKNGQPIKGEFANYSSKTDGQTFGARITQVLMRNQTDKFSGYGELLRRRNKNYVNGAMTDVNSHPYTDLNTGLQYITRLGGGSLYSELTYNRGLSLFDGEKAAFNSSDHPINYQKLGFNLAWSRDFALLNQPLQFSSRMSGQYSNDKLLDSNKMVVGDEYTVRGYKSTSFYGDRGVTLTNTLSLPLAPLGGMNLTPFVGLDASWLEDVDHTHSTVYGSALGLKSTYSVFNSSVTLGLPLGYQSERVQSTDPWVVYFNVGMSL